MPTHNRKDSLQRALLGVVQQTAAYDQFEVIVVADGCTDDTRDMLDDFTCDFSLTVVEIEGAGAAVARNHGARLAKGKILIFMDDDEVPCQEFIAQHIRCHEEERNRLVIGPYLPVIKRRTSYFRTNIRSWWYDQFTNMERKGHRFSYRDFLAGNVSMMKSDFKSLGGFDESFRYIEGFKGACSCEDWELGVRAITQGLDFHYCAQAYADHFEHETTNLRKFMARATQEGRGEFMMAERHPEIIENLQLANYKAGSFFEGLPLHLALYHSGFIDGFFMMMRWSLPLFEYFRLRRSWRKICGFWRQYWYWKGLTERLRSRKEIETFVKTCRSGNSENIDWLVIDLAHDINSLVAKVDRLRPEALAIVYGELQIANILPSYGKEKLRGKHLKNLLYEYLQYASFTWSLPLQNREEIGE